MKQASREFALSRSWDAVFDGVYEAYGEAKAHLAKVRAEGKLKKQGGQNNTGN